MEQLVPVSMRLTEQDVALVEEAQAIAHTATKATAVSMLFRIGIELMRSFSKNGNDLFRPIFGHSDGSHGDIVTVMKYEDGAEYFDNHWGSSVDEWLIAIEASA